MHTGKLASKPEHVLGPDHLQRTSVNVAPQTHTQGSGGPGEAVQGIYNVLTVLTST